MQATLFQTFVFYLITTRKDLEDIHTCGFISTKFRTAKIFSKTFPSTFLRSRERQKVHQAIKSVTETAKKNLSCLDDALHKPNNPLNDSM